jgi:hypothetical protein
LGEQHRVKRPYEGNPPAPGLEAASEGGLSLRIGGGPFNEWNNAGNWLWIGGGLTNDWSGAAIGSAGLGPEATPEPVSGADVEAAADKETPPEPFIVDE